MQLGNPWHLLLTPTLKGGEREYSEDEIFIWSVNPDLGKLGFYHLRKSGDEDLATSMGLHLKISQNIEATRLARFESSSLPADEFAETIFRDMFVDDGHHVDTAIIMFDEGVDLLQFMDALSRMSVPGTGVNLIEVIQLKAHNFKAQDIDPIEMLLEYKRSNDKILELPSSLQYALFGFNFVTK